MPARDALPAGRAGDRAVTAPTNGAALPAGRDRPDRPCSRLAPAAAKPSLAVLFADSPFGRLEWFEDDLVQERAPIRAPLILRRERRHAARLAARRQCRLRAAKRAAMQSLSAAVRIRVNPARFWWRCDGRWVGSRAVGGVVAPAGDRRTMRSGLIGAWSAGRRGRGAHQFTGSAFIGTLVDSAASPARSAPRLWI